MNIARTIVLMMYITASIVAFFVIGLFSRKYKILTSKPLLTLIFAVNFLLQSVGFYLPLVGSLVINLISIGAFWLGIKIKVIGLTGGIASGKSTVSKILREEGFTIIDADEISHNLRKYDVNY